MMTPERLKDVAQSKEMLDLINMEASCAAERIINGAKVQFNGEKVDGIDAYIMTSLLAEEFKLQFTLIINSSMNELMNKED